MSQQSPLAAPTPLQPGSTLAPPAIIRPSSSSSARSNGSSRRGKSGNSSNNVSRSNSHSSSGSKKVTGNTVTVSGGVRIGSTDKSGNAGDSSTKGGNEKKATSQKGNEAQVGAGDEGKGKKGQNQNNKRANPNSKRPTPVNTAPPANNRSVSQTSTASTAPVSGSETKSANAPKSIHAPVSAPRTAIEAAVEAASKKHSSIGGGDVFANLQRIISDMKAIPNTSGPSTATSQPGSRSVSGNKEQSTASAANTKATPSPIAIPDSANSAKKQLKADAPSFTPSFQPSVSPVASQPAVSPGIPTVPLSGAQSRSQSHGSASAPKRASSSATAGGFGSISQFGVMPNLNASPVAVFSNTVPNYNLYQNQLQVHQEVDNEDLSPLAFPPTTDVQYQQQLLAAQQLQYQQIQLLQAQLMAQQQQQQQQQQHQTAQTSMGSFIAPRFQALAIQRAAQQQAQQAQQLLQAQQLYEMQQAQILEMQRQQEAQANAQAHAQAQAQAQATLANPPPVFEEDSPEPVHASLGPTGRPQLAPTFTFGAKKAAAEAAEKASMSPPTNPPVINRSEGIGGAHAAGLAGLAARAHKRTGSELTPAMQQQLEIQSQIEALQAKQKALMQEELASQGVSGATSLSQISEAFTHKQTPSQTLSRHRRAQSGLASGNFNDDFANIGLNDTPDAGLPRQAVRPVGEMLPPPVPVAPPVGHNRRHSASGFNKTAGHGAGFSISSDIPEDGFPTGSISISGPGNGNGHHRSGSRSGFESGSWRSNSQSNGAGPMGAGPVTDLASAQAQLQSLAQFRAAAGGGHSKMASFSFPNMLPNLLAATTLQAPAGQSLWQQQQAFQMQLQQTTLGPQRKSLFAPYLPQASLPPLLQAGKLVVGVLRVNKKNRSDAYVATDVLEADIYICGSKDRNRALEGDIVAIELLDVDEVWNTKKDKEEKKRKKEENSVYDLKPAVAKKLEKKKDDVEVEGQGLTLFDEEEVNDETKPTYAGHVVAVVERMPGQLFSGQLGVLRPSSAATKEKQEIERREREGDRPGHHASMSISQSISKREDLDGSASRPKIVWFKPTDKRVPLIAIPTEQAPIDFIENPDTYADRLFVATIKRWPITSLHPFGTLVEELGPIGNPEVETSALLKDCNFPVEEFTDMTMKCLPPLPWSIPDREYDVRKDYREERVFTIDPPNAKDLDDALSIVKNESGTHTVRVHIADVSYFVKSNTAMDREARKRATSVYLVQRCVPMLPPQLSEELCSLQPGVDRLAFTASFEVDDKAKIVNQEFARTIIKSCGKLAYSDAQNVIDGGKLDESKVQGHGIQDIESDVKALYDIASKLRKKRQEAGAMMHSKIKVSFQLDDEGRPIDCEAYRKTDANVLVEEFMLLANTSVARAIAFGLPEQSLLRRHEAPLERRIEGFVDRAHKLGYHFDATSAGTLQKVFDGISDADQDVALCLELLKRKAMQRARYFCTGMLDIAKYAHWSLNVPLYTHFTSPIRRYADVLVHRMLDACLNSPNPLEVKFHMERDQVAKCAQQCNMKKQSAKLAEDQSTHLYLCMLIHDLTEKYGPVVREGRVTGVLDAAFDVVIPEFGIEKRVHVDKMPVDNTVYDEHRDILSLYWTDQDVLTYLASTLEDPHFLKLKALRDHHNLEATQKESLLQPETQSGQYSKSANRGIPQFEGLRKDVAGGHRVQDVRELMKVQVIVVSDVTKSPPVLVVYACNPFAPN